MTPPDRTSSFARALGVAPFLVLLAAVSACGACGADDSTIPVDAVTVRVLAQDSRDTRMSLAEKKAAALPPKLTVPMVLFFLPVLFAIIISPAIIQLMAVRH